MARKPKSTAQSPYKLKQWRLHSRLTLEQVGEALNMTGQNYGKIERGSVELRELYVQQLAELFGIDAADLLRDPSDNADHPTSETVPVVGYVGAGSVATLFAEGQGPLDYVEPPQNATASTVGLKVQGVSLGPVWDEAILFYDDVRSPVTPDLHGRLCVVGLPDGRVLVKMLKAANDGTFHLLSNTSEEPLLNQEVIWAARVKAVHPR